ncbi:hypothetical protein Pla52n_33620 [Stieleria varia]|uniref:Uncharacterized protein n=1 Tax=Stieleria varia TaxID=2528005 RepID=A0A5C6ATH3_9BACT|nr:hypothetical protein Pla52n_33620 [Stieleria varia]
MNRRMRTRMYGGVRGVPGNRAPISIMVLWLLKRRMIVPQRDV